MSILTVVAVIIAVGILLFAVNKYVTFMDANAKYILNIVVICALVFWLLKIFGIFALFASVKV